MSESKNRQWILKARPAGKLTGEEFLWNETPIPQLSDGEVLIQTMWLSIDATQRIWMARDSRRARMEGFTGLDYPTRVPEAFEALGRWQRDGSLVHKEDVAHGLESASKALLRLFSGENFGKQLVKVADLAA